MKIDAEVHFWKFNKLSGNQYIRDNKILNQDYLPEQITQNLHRNGIEGCITVAVDDSEVETRFLSELAATHPEILAVIGWLDLYDSKASDKIREFQQYKPIRGYFIEFENDRELSAGVMELLNENQYSLDFTMRQGMNTNSVDKWLNAYPDQQFILQKGGSPDTGHGPTTAWENQIHELAKNKNLSCKLTGLLTGGSNLKSWSPKDFIPSWIFFSIHLVQTGSCLPVTGHFYYWRAAMYNGRAWLKNLWKNLQPMTGIKYLVKMRKGSTGSEKYFC